MNLRAARRLHQSLYIVCADTSAGQDLNSSACPIDQPANELAAFQSRILLPAGQHSGDAEVDHLAVLVLAYRWLAP